MKPRTLRWLSLWVVCSLLLSATGTAAAAPPPPLNEVDEIQLVETTPVVVEAGAGYPIPLPRGIAFFDETEPNDTAGTANILIGTPVVVHATINPATEVDYFAFTATAGDRVYAATMTQASNGGSTDTVLDVISSDGTTVLETDDENGSFSGSASAIGGTIIPADGTYYIRVDGYSSSSLITPYYLHVRVQSGMPTAEVEPNNDLATATPLGPTGWMSGTITATTDPDLFSFTLNAGDSVYIALDMDPDRATTNTNWNGRVGLGVFGGYLLVANDSSTTKPHAEALFMTVQEAGTYYAYVDSTSATGLGANARYHLSVSVYPKQVQSNCTTFTSTDVPKVLTGTVTSTLVVPGTVTSSISDINATIVLTHNLMADLDVMLTGPTAASTPLFTDIGSAATGGLTTMDVGLDDQAALPIGPFTVVQDIIYQPEQPGRLATFNGLPAGGTWTLQLADDTLNTSGGNLQSWSLEICGDPPPAYGIELQKTVGVEPGVCASTDSIEVPSGGFDVYYCYTVRNTGLNSLTTHDLVDSELGTIFTDLPYTLTSGATYSHIQQATIHATVVNTGTWTASDGAGNITSDDDTAMVTVRSFCPAGYRDVTLDYSYFDGTFPPTGWTVTNTSSACNPPGVPDWTNTNPGNRTNLTGGVGPFAIADSDRCGSGSMLDTIMSTGMLDFTGLVSPTVSFYTDYNDIATGGDQGLLDVSTDGGATWNNLFTWDADYRGPLLVNQALTGAAGENDVMVRWHYSQATYDWWWEVDDAFLTACELLEPAIVLTKTVGTEAGVCATANDITVVEGTTVYYCYEVANTGDVTLNLHDLVDDQLGTIFSGLNYALHPGESVNTVAAGLSIPAVMNVTTVNTAIWTAYNVGPTDVVTATSVATVTVELTPNIDVDPLSLSSTQAQDVVTNQTLDIANTGGADLTWEILEDPWAVLRSAAGGKAPRVALAGASGSRGGTAGGAAPRTYLSMADFSEGFDDITLLPGLGWFFQNNSSPLGTTDWFQGNDAVFPAQAGAVTAYIGANFNNTAGVGAISNWMLTPEISLADGDTISFWTRVPTGSAWPDRLEVRLSTNGASTNVGTLATDVGDFTTLLLSINPTLAAGGYPDVWTQFSATLTGIPAGATGRVAFRYFVENGGPSGTNSNYIGIDTVEYVGAQAPCAAPADVPWLSANPISGTTAAGGTTPVDVTFDSTALAPGIYTANLCVESNDPDAGPGNGTDLVVVPVTLTVTRALIPSIVLTKTVGTVDGVCATTDDITVMEGTTVYYCYTVANTGDVTLNLHGLVDDQLGTIFSGLNYALTPGSSVNTVAAGLSIPAVMNVTTVNTATWTAYNTGGPSVTATDTARVTVTPSAVSVTGLRASPSGGWSSVALLGALVLSGFAWRRKRR